MLSIKNLTVNVGKKKILKGINFTFEEGKIYAVMGPNGSGKSTLAYSLMGHPAYTIEKKSRILLGKKNISELKPEQRSRAGLFLSFQTPMSLSGVNVNQLLLIAQKGKKDPVHLREEIRRFATELKIKEELVSRSLNDGASGGEKKKMEVLQAMVMNKNVLIFDEIDTGVDVDALRTISQFLLKHKQEKTYIIITHYNRILHYLRPDKILVLVEGQLKKVGDYKLADKIEKAGYEIAV